MGLVYDGKLQHGIWKPLPINEFVTDSGRSDGYEDSNDFSSSSSEKDISFFQVKNRRVDDINIWVITNESQMKRIECDEDKDKDKKGEQSWPSDGNMREYESDDIYCCGTLMTPGDFERGSVAPGPCCCDGNENGQYDDGCCFSDCDDCSDCGDCDCSGCAEIAECIGAFGGC